MDKSIKPSGLNESIKPPITQNLSAALCFMIFVLSADAETMQVSLGNLHLSPGGHRPCRAFIKIRPFTMVKHQPKLDFSKWNPSSKTSGLLPAKHQTAGLVNATHLMRLPGPKIDWYYRGYNPSYPFIRPFIGALQLHLELVGAHLVRWLKSCTT